MDGQKLTGKAAIAFDIRLTHLINDFFRFQNKNKHRTDALAEKIAHLDKLWRNWLKLHEATYDFPKFCDHFLWKLDVLISFKIKLAEYMNVITQHQRAQ